MQVTLLGVQNIDFTNNNGNKISGVNIYVAFEDENTSGLRTEKFFLKDGIALPKEVKFNDKINLSFNMKGKVETVSRI